MRSAPKLSIRLANPADRVAISQLVRFEEQVHAHLDWRPIEEWLGAQPFLLMEQGRRPVAALACPPDPADTAWLRLFVTTSGFEAANVWPMLWSRAQAMLAAQQVHQAAVVSVEGWIDELCLRSGFQRSHMVVVLSRRRGGPLPTLPPLAVIIRPAQARDHAAIIATDLAAFMPPWQNSPELLNHALKQADYVTVAEAHGQVVGYQLTTLSPQTAHLARLVVVPGWQGRGLGATLVADLIRHYEQRGARELTVNTQSNNAASLTVYRRMGFIPNGAQYPVFQFSFQ
jgi:ribosomal protein S18 acetylase RimI-like enzyme